MRQLLRKGQKFEEVADLIYRRRPPDRALLFGRMSNIGIAQCRPNAEKLPRALSTSEDSEKGNGGSRRNDLASGTTTIASLQPRLDAKRGKSK